MMAKRTVLLAMLICLTGVAAYGQVAVAPTNQGDIGLLTMPTADNPRAGQFTFGVYGWLEQRVAGPLQTGDPDRIRVYDHLAGEATFGLGLTRWWSVFVGAGIEDRRSRGDWQQGVVNGIPLVGPFDISEGRKVRIGSKFNFVSEADPDFRVGFWLAGHVPVSNATITIDENGTVTDQINSRRADWEWGGAATKGIFTGMVSYTLAGRHDEDIRPSNDLRFGFGVDVPISIAHLIFEVDRHVLDGGDRPEPDYSMLVMGGRFFIGHTGWAVSGGVNANLDMMTTMFGFLAGAWAAAAAASASPIRTTRILRGGARVMVVSFRGLLCRCLVGRGVARQGMAKRTREVLHLGAAGH